MICICCERIGGSDESSSLPPPGWGPYRAPGSVAKYPGSPFQVGNPGDHVATRRPGPPPCPAVSGAYTFATRTEVATTATTAAAAASGAIRRDQVRDVPAA